MGSEQFYTAHHFAQALTPTMISAHQLTPPPTVDPSSTTTTIKMEDLAVPYGTPSQLPPTSHPSESSPPPSDGRHPKKRKSWGQVLPEPKTNLPPRKRAKTEDEKEQRRIERVKRNRLAAHNSRERKRQEYELLQNEKDQLEQDLHDAQRAMNRMAAELKAFRQKYPSESFSGIPSSNASTIDDYESILGRTESHTICPRQTHSFPSPVSMDSMDSPRDDSCAPDTPAYTESVATDFDQTRYPAAILCDLQCQSNSEATSSSSRQPPFPATLAFLILFNLTLNTPSMRSLLTLFSTSTSSQKTTSSLLAAWWITTTSSLATSSTTLTQTLTAFLTTLAQDTSICRQTQAQHSLLATRLSQRRSSAKAVARPSGLACRVPGQGTAERRRRSRSYRLRRTTGGRKGLLSLKQETLRSLESFQGMAGKLDNFKGSRMAS